MHFSSILEAVEWLFDGEAPSPREKVVNGMRWFQRKERKKDPLRFEDAARFNWALDTDRELQDGMARLAEEFPNLTEESYTQRALALFRQAGLDLSAADLKILLALRRETDSMLLRQKGQEDHT